MPNTQAEMTKLRVDVNAMIDLLGLEIGWRQHFARVLQCHPSSINNAVNGSRSGPREKEILLQLNKYLHGLYKYFQKCAPVNTKMQ